MKKLLTFTLLLLTTASFAQTPGGSLGIGFFAACPQNELKDISYDDGWGMSLSYLTRERALAPAFTYVYGGRMDFSSMSNKEFGTIPLNTPVEDLADLKVSNQMFGFFGVGRVYGGAWKVRPFAEALVGLRTFNTQQELYAQNPQLNPEYEPQSVYDKVVYTSRFHYGGSLGVHYRMNKYFSFESSVTYTFGETGAVMPLQNVSREGDILNYPHQQSATDMLLINAGVKIHLFKSERKYSTNGSSGPSERSDPTYTSPNAPKKRETPPPKKKLEVKPPSKPKKIDTSES